MLLITCLFRNLNGELNVESPVDETSRERVNVATLRNVFFHTSVVSTDREKRLSVIEEPIPTVSQISGNRMFTPCDEGQSLTSTDESLHC